MTTDDPLAIVCAFCGTENSVVAANCVNCEMELDPDEVEISFRERSEMEGRLESKDLEEEIDFSEKLKHLRRDRILFYVGIFFIVVGGPGLILGSWSYKLFDVELFEISSSIFDRFGILVVSIGVMMLLAGVLLCLIAAKSGIVRKANVEIVIAEE